MAAKNPRIETKREKPKEELLQRLLEHVQTMWCGWEDATNVIGRLKEVHQGEFEELSTRIELMERSIVELAQEISDRLNEAKSES